MKATTHYIKQNDLTVHDCDDTLDDLRIIEQHQERQGLAMVAASWPDFDEVAESLADLDGLRRRCSEVLACD